MPQFPSYQLGSLCSWEKSSGDLQRCTGFHLLYFRLCPSHLGSPALTMIDAGMPYRNRGAWDAVQFAGTHSSGAMQTPLNPTRKNPDKNCTCQRHPPSLRVCLGDEEPAGATSGRKERVRASRPCPMRRESGAWVPQKSGDRVRVAAPPSVCSRLGARRRRLCSGVAIAMEAGGPRLLLGAGWRLRASSGQHGHRGSSSEAAAGSKPLPSCPTGWEGRNFPQVVLSRIWQLPEICSCRKKKIWFPFLPVLRRPPASFPQAGGDASSLEISLILKPGLPLGVSPRWNWCYHLRVLSTCPARLG